MAQVPVRVTVMPCPSVASVDVSVRATPSDGGSIYRDFDFNGQGGVAEFAIATEYPNRLSVTVNSQVAFATNPGWNPIRTTSSGVATVISPGRFIRTRDIFLRILDAAGAIDVTDTSTLHVDVTVDNPLIPERTVTTVYDLTQSSPIQVGWLVPSGSDATDPTRMSLSAAGIVAEKLLRLSPSRLPTTGPSYIVVQSGQIRLISDS